MKNDDEVIDDSVESPGSKEHRTHVERLLASTQSWELFHDDNRVAYATFTVPAQDGVPVHREHWLIQSDQVRDWLGMRFFRDTGRPPQDKALGTALASLEAQARFSGAAKAVHYRVASNVENGNEVHYVDLCDENWRAMRVSRDGWSVCSNPPVTFIRSTDMEALPEPVHGGSIMELREFVNVETDDDFKLVVMWLIGALKPKGPYPVLVLVGGDGSAKSTTSDVLCSVDPNRMKRRSLPRNKYDFIIAASNTHVLAFDNISKLSGQMSDEISRLATGGSFGTRTHYKNREETTFSVQCPIVMNGIENFVWREDLISRSMILMLPKIDARCTEEDLKQRFDAAWPRIFGALLDAVSCALQRRASIRLTHLPRMADFASWAVAAEPAFQSDGWAPGDFLKAYERNQHDTVVELLQNDRLANLLLKLVKKKEWTGTMEELLEKLMYLGDSASGLPRTANALSGALRRKENALKRFGVRFERLGRTNIARPYRIWFEDADRPSREAA